MFLELLFPKKIKCLVCDREIEGHFLCDICLASVQFNIGRTCMSCGRMIYDQALLCHHCKGLIRHYDDGFSAVLYDDFIKGLLYQFKYNNKTHLGEYMAIEILERLKKSQVDYDYIVPVPLHKRRYRKRGYNQAAIIAEFLSRYSGIPIRQPLKRIKRTKALNKLNYGQRKIVLEGAFESDKISGNIILIDDIFTTGSTLNACSETLKKAGAGYITIATFAVGQ